jgi:hypothetical protein
MLSVIMKRFWQSNKHLEMKKMLCIYHYATSKNCTQVGSRLASKYQTKREVTETGKDLSLLQLETNFDDSINHRKWLKFKIFFS